MSEKVKLPREVADAIDYYRNGTELDFPTQAIMKVAMEDVRYIGDPDYCEVIKEYVKSADNLQVLMQALVNGYEVEQTPEDKVRDAFNYALAEIEKLSDHPQVEHWKGMKSGIIITLGALHIKIEGVNA